MKPVVLIIDDEASIRMTLRMNLMDQYTCLDAESIGAAIKEFEKNEVDFVLLDIRLGKESGVDFLHYLSKNRQAVPVICISGEASYSEAIEAYKLGALDFLQKPINSQTLFASINRCVSQHKMKERSRAIISDGRPRADLVGQSSAIVNLRRQISELAPSDAKVLILGETGTGKEIIAQMIHQSSPRRDEPFIVVDCGSLPSSLLESTLFGYKKGAFTGANQDQIGRLECADGGTLFLDELAELTMEGQNRLLRFLETGEIQRIGANKTSKVDVRVIAATSRNIEECINKGSFRSDLYYRLSVFTLKTPSLRSISDDVQLILQSLLEGFCKKMNRPVPAIDEDLAGLLRGYPWPGNVRELRNLAERFAIIGNKSAFDSLRPEPKSVAPIAAGVNDIQVPYDPKSPLTLKEMRNIAEKQYIEKLLDLTSGNVSATARMLGIDRVSLHQKMNVLQINRK